MSLMNAAGTCRDLEGAKLLASHRAVSEVCIGSYTPDRSVGFPEAYICTTRGTSYNAKLMPNCGLDEFLKELPEFIQIAKSAGKILRISLAAPTIEGFLHMLRSVIGKLGSDIVHVIFELNSSCGNDKKMFNAYDPGFIEGLVRMLGRKQLEYARKAIKLSPIPPIMPLFHSVVQALKVSPGSIQEVVACNTYPGTFYPWSAKLANQIGFASMGGDGLHYIALGMVRALYLEHLLPGIEITGVGGIRDMNGVVRMRIAEAYKVQIGTAFIEDGLTVFDRIGVLTSD